MNSDSLLGLLQHDLNNDDVAIIRKISCGFSIHATYREFSEFSEKIVNTLEKNLVDSTFIGIQLDPCISLPSIIFGILKHGAGFVCMEPDEPVEGWNHRLCDKLGLCWLFVAGTPEESDDVVVSSLEFKGETISLVKCKILPSVKLKSSKKFAYACQTSGSTGTPKIVQVPHESITPNVTHLRSMFGVGRGDIVLQAAAPTFDPSVVEIFVTLSSGATLLMFPRAAKSSPAQLAQLLASDPRPTVIQATPSLITSLGLQRIQTLLLGKDSQLRVMALGGEPCPGRSVLDSWKSPGNCTAIFNLYGVTEVSCWSTCHKVQLSPDFEQDKVPLGEPFPHTQLQVRDLKGQPVTCGEGELFISNGSRMCLVEDQPDTPDTTRWCATGDLVQVTAGGSLFFLGRHADTRVVKRWGHKVSLAAVEAAASHSGLVQACCAICDATKALQLVLFVVLQPSATTHEVTRHLRSKLPSTSQPDALIILESWPLTRHGKIDKVNLKKLAIEWENTETKKQIDFQPDPLQVENAVREAWQSALPGRVSADLQDDSSFLASGGDSALAALVAAELLRWVGRNEGPTVLTALLEASFRDVCTRLLELAQRPASVSDEDKATDPKRPRLDSQDLLIDIDVGHSHMWRAAATKPGQPELQVALSRGNYLVTNTTQSQQINPGSRHANLRLEVLWSQAMVKCVDASPLVLQYVNEESLAVISSHSGRVLCVDVQSGGEKWSLKLGDRVESSAAVSPCGQFVLLGCYDGKVYCIEVHTGNCCWAFQTGAMVKSTPVVFESTVMVGSYDQCVYCLNLLDGAKLWHRSLEAGALLASPCIAGKAVLVATLGGLRTALCALSGATKWSTSGGKPHFTTPSRLGDDRAVFGNVDGVITCVDTHSGTEIWTYHAKGNLFTNFAIQNITKDSYHIVFGCSDQCVYCLDEAGVQIWTSKLSGRITGSPFLFQAPFESNSGEILLAIVNAPQCLTILKAASGTICCQKILPKETFSSPVVLKDVIVVGSRDNSFYCFQLL